MTLYTPLRGEGREKAMQRSERLNDMMVFLNGRDSFHLRDLMEQYDISKSTALRDVNALERIGMPIYTQRGRNGHYGFLHNRLLSPIVFNFDEVFAMYFSMLTLRAYQATPFHISVEKLKEKFERCLSAEKRAALRNIERVFSLSAIEQTHACQYLKEALQYAAEEKVCTVVYQKEEVMKECSVQFFHISAAYGQWYATGYHFETDSVRIFRCDKILKIEASMRYSPKPLRVFLVPDEELYKAKGATDFEAEINTKGADHFQKEHYPSMKLHQQQERVFIRGFYNRGEERFISDYLIGFGENLLSISPQALKERIKDRIHAVHQYFSKL